MKSTNKVTDRVGDEDLEIKINTSGAIILVCVMGHSWHQAMKMEAETFFETKNRYSQLFY